MSARPRIWPHRRQGSWSTAEWGDPSRALACLVGSDLVLTARHVLKYHICGWQTDRSLARGAVLPSSIISMAIRSRSLTKRLLKILKEALRVRFHPDKWLIDSCDDFPGEPFREPTEEQIAALKMKLDYALIRLAEADRKLLALRPWWAPPRLVRSVGNSAITDPCASMSGSSSRKHPLRRAAADRFWPAHRADPSGPRLRYGHRDLSRQLWRAVFQPEIPARRHAQCGIQSRHKITIFNQARPSRQHHGARVRELSAFSREQRLGALER